nr:MAG TPA_asm: hypothetical protein [Caudoviricetes sp.]
MPGVYTTKIYKSSYLMQKAEDNSPTFCYQTILINFV